VSRKAYDTIPPPTQIDPIIGVQGFHVTDAHDGREFTPVRFAVVMGDDVIGDFLEPSRGLHNLGGINRLDLDVLHPVLALEGADILDREF
jgi:hypothetical protein